MTVDSEPTLVSSKTVLLALNCESSKQSQKVISWAIENLDKTEKLILLSIQKIDPAPFSISDLPILDLQEKQIRSILNVEQKNFISVGFQDVCVVAIRGYNVKEELVERSLDYQCDVLVMGYSNLPWLMRKFKTGVSDYCISKCKCAVIAVK